MEKRVDLKEGKCVSEREDRQTEKEESISERKAREVREPEGLGQAWKSCSRGRERRYYVIVTLRTHSQGRAVET
jgi:hypothetical protein